MNRKYCLIFLILALISCRLNQGSGYCLPGDSFDISIIGGGISKITQKLILENIINESSINFDEKSDLLIELRITLRRNTILMSLNNTVAMESLNFMVYYWIKDKTDKTIFDNGRFVIVDDLNVSDNRFANYATENYIMDNFSKNLSVKLENKIASLLMNKKCKKVLK